MPVTVVLEEEDYGGIDLHSADVAEGYDLQMEL